jgi:hypothetical protein
MGAARIDWITGVIGRTGSCSRLQNINVLRILTVKRLRKVAQLRRLLGSTSLFFVVFLL